MTTMVLLMLSIINIQFLEWLNENYCILTCLFGCKQLLCFFVFYGCEQRVFWLPNKQQTLDIQNILPLCKLNIIKIISRLRDLKNK